MLKLHKREELKEILQRRSSLNHELSKLQRSALMQLNNHTTQELQSNQKAPGGSPAHIRINLQQFALPKILHTSKVITNKYIGEYNNMLGIITSKHKIPSRDCTYRSASSSYSLSIVLSHFLSTISQCFYCITTLNNLLKNRIMSSIHSFVLENWGAFDEFYIYCLFQFSLLQKQKLLLNSFYSFNYIQNTVHYSHHMNLSFLIQLLHIQSVQYTLIIIKLQQFSQNPMISQTQTINQTSQTILHLNNSQPQETQQQQQKKETKKRSVQWTEDTVDNEDLGRLKSNICCIYHKPHAEESESSDTCTSDDEINAIERDKQSKLRHKMKCSKLNKKCC